MKVCIKTNDEPLTLLKYFNIFNHPLKLEEIYKFSSGPETMDELKSNLLDLQIAGIIKKIGNFYLCNDADDTNVFKRLMGEKKAKELMPKAMKVGKLLSYFPFVKFVGISGSLSKGYANDKSDFDFFIITANNTLWICRTILHVFKKISFLFRKQHYLCMNYFMDEKHLVLDERNLFTRIELSTLIPVYNENLYNLLLCQNKKTLLNFTHLGGNICDEDVEVWAIINNNAKNIFFKPLNLLLMKLTDLKWRRKWKKRNYPMEDYDLAFKTTPYISKNHYKNTQKVILQQLQKNKS